MGLNLDYKNVVNLPVSLMGQETPEAFDQNDRCVSEEKSEHFFPKFLGFSTQLFECYKYKHVIFPFVWKSVLLSTWTTST